jgi:hypothetical protein
MEVVNRGLRLSSKGNVLMAQARRQNRIILKFQKKLKKNRNHFRKMTLYSKIDPVVTE